MRTHTDTHTWRVGIHAVEDRLAARRLNVTCSFPCQFYIERHGGAPFEVVEAKGQPDDIIKTLEGHVSPLLTQVATDAEAEAFSKNHAVAALVVLKGGVLSKANKSPEYAAMEEAAKKLRGKVAVMWADKGIGGVKAPGVRMWVNSSTPREVSMNANGSVLARNMVAMSWGFDMFNYTWNKRELFDSVQLPVAHVFLDDAAAPDTVALFQDAAKDSRGELAFVRFSKKDSFMLKDFGLAEDKLPSFGIADHFGASAKRYGMEDSLLGPAVPREIPDATATKPEDWNDEEDGDWEAPLVPNPEFVGERRAKRFSKEAVVSFVQDYLNGKLKPSYKSEPEPLRDAPPGKVRDVVYKTLHAQGAAGAEEHTLLLLYQPYAPGKDKDLAAVTKVAEAFENLPLMRMGKMDTTRNHVDTDRFVGFEEHRSKSALYLLSDGKATQYKGGMAQADIFKFLAKNVKAVKENWEGKVKPKLKEIKERAAEAKRQVEEAAAKKKEAMEAEKKRIDALLADTEKIDVSKAKDGGIIKQIVKAGEGEASPKAGDKVKAHYTGTLLDGSTFDSSRERGTAFEFVLGQGQVIPCWDVGMATMKKREHAFLTCTSDNAYGEDKEKGEGAREGGRRGSGGRE